MKNQGKGKFWKKKCKLYFSKEVGYITSSSLSAFLIRLEGKFQRKEVKDI